MLTFDRPASKRILIHVESFEGITSYMTEEKVLEKHSATFRAREPEDPGRCTLKLGDIVDVDMAFSTYLHWIHEYQLCLDSVDDIWRCSQNRFIVSGPQCVRLLKCYSIGCFMQDDDFKDAVVDAMIDTIVQRQLHWLHLPCALYELAPAGSVARRMV